MEKRQHLAVMFLIIVAAVLVLSFKPATTGMLIFNINDRNLDLGTYTNTYYNTDGLEEEVEIGEQVEDEIIITNNGLEDLNNVKLALEGIPIEHITIFPQGYETIKPGESQKFKIVYNTGSMVTGNYAGVYTAVADEGVIMQKDTMLVVKEKRSGAAKLSPTIKRIAPWMVGVIFVLAGAGFLVFWKFRKKKAKS